MSSRRQHSTTTVALDLIKSPAFRKQAVKFARWYGLERKAVLELGKIAASWLEHYSRARNAERLADALRQITGLKVTGRTLRYYRDIYLISLVSGYKSNSFSWLQSSSISFAE